MTSSEYFDAVRHLPSAADIPETLDAGTAAIVLVIPQGFERTVQRGGTATVQGLIDGANASPAQTAQGYARPSSRPSGRAWWPPPPARGCQ